MMSEFGKLLRFYRSRATDPEKQGQLTQERLGMFIGHYLEDEGYTGPSISNWERGISNISHLDRNTLLAIVKSLRHCQGIAPH